MMLTDFDKGRLYERRELLEMLNVLLETQDDDTLRKYLTVYRDEVATQVVPTIVITETIIQG